MPAITLNSGTFDYGNLADAVAAASSYDTIHITTVDMPAGGYVGSANIDKALTIIGTPSGGNRPILKAPTDTDATNGAVLCITSGDTVTISEIRVTGAGDAGDDFTVGIRLDSGILYLSDSDVTGISSSTGYTGTGIMVAGSTVAYLDNISITGYQSAGLLVDGGLAYVELTGSTITGAGGVSGYVQNGIVVTNLGYGIFTGNTISDNIYTGASSGPDWYDDDQAAGIRIDDGYVGINVSANTIENNDIGLVHYAPYTLSSLTATLIRENSLTDNLYYGIVLDAGYAQLSGNLIIGGDYGVAAFTSPNATQDSTGKLSNNRICESGVAGLYSEDQADDANPVIIVFNKPADQSNFDEDEISEPVSWDYLGSNSLEFSATGLPDDIEIDPDTGKITGTLASDASESGQYYVTVTATDAAANMAASHEFTWFVQQPPAEPTPRTVWLRTTPGLWSLGTNWSNGVPDSTKIAVFQPGANGAGTGNCTYDNSVQAANRVVAGLRADGGWAGTLTLSAGFALTVTAIPGDAGTGLKWLPGEAGTISQASANDVLTLDGGDNNLWNGGKLGSTTTLGNIYITNRGFLGITGNAFDLGSNIVLGQDGLGGCTLQFDAQAATLQVFNGAVITVSDTTDDGGPNRILFTADTTDPDEAVSYGIARAPGNTTSYIENYGTIARTNDGTYRIALPIRNNSSYYPATLDIESTLWITQAKNFSGTPVSVYQAAGAIILQNAAWLKCQGVIVNGGELKTNGAGTAGFERDNGFNDVLLRMAGGTLTVSAADPTQYGTFWIQGDMLWTGGTFETYVQGNNAALHTQLLVGRNLTLTNTAHLHVNVVGDLTNELTWDVVATGAGGRITDSLTFDNNDWFIAYSTQGGIRRRIDVMSPPEE